METMTDNRSVEQIIAGIQKGNPFQFEARFSLIPGKVWTLSKNGSRLTLSNNTNSTTKSISLKDAGVILHNNLQIL